MRWLIRTDSSVQLGAGHVMRCLTLAKRARARGVPVEFICRDLPGALLSEIRASGFTLHSLSAELSDDFAPTLAIAATAPVNWLVVDHYGIDAAWERRVRPAVSRILVIDDLANRPHDCDVLLDPNYWPDAHNRYRNLVPLECDQLLGPRYLLLRDEFVRVRAGLRRSYAQVQRILVNFGGTDEPNVTCMALESLAALDLPDLQVDVVIGSTNPHHAEVAQQLARLPRAQLHVQTNRIAELVANADLAIGACGSSTWERCYLGLPTLALVLADNQRLAAEQLDRDGVLVNLGGIQAETPLVLLTQLRAIIADGSRRALLSARSFAMMPAELLDATSVLLRRSADAC